MSVLAGSKQIIAESGKARIMAKLITTLLIFTVFLVASAQAYDATFIDALCNTQKTTTTSALYKAIGLVLSDLAQQTPYYSYDYKDSETSGGVTAWGRATCRYGLSDCNACLKYIGTQILPVCGNAIGARYQATDCFIEYENYSF
jgi:hypothetical protein